MTKLLERAFAEARCLPDADQDALAARLLAEMNGHSAHTDASSAETGDAWSPADEWDATAFALAHAAATYDGDRV